jgi:hypothetical protein
VGSANTMMMMMVKMKKRKIVWVKVADMQMIPQNKMK